MTSVLVVEDDESLRMMYAFALQHDDFEVALASNGAEAVVWVRERQFDVILLDMLMSGMSGLDFLRAYDVRKECPQTKVIALTNFDSSRIIEEARALGVVGYLIKSEHEPQQLGAYIRSLLGSRSF